MLLKHVLYLHRLAVIPTKMWRFSPWTLSGNCPWSFWRRGSWPTSDSRKTFWGLSSTSWKRTGRQTSGTFICAWMLKSLLPCRSAVQTLWLSVLTISGLFLTWLQTRTRLLLSTSVAVRLLFSISLSVSLLSLCFLWQWVSILFGNGTFQLTHFSLFALPSQWIHVKTISFPCLGPKQSWMESEQLSAINELDFAVVTAATSKGQAVLLQHPFHSCERGVAV